MNTETERKFLIKQGDAFREMVASSSFIAQGYMDVKGATVRIRLRTPVGRGATVTTYQDTMDEEQGKAYLTIKGPSYDGGLSRYEFEREIPLDDAREMLRLCRGGVVEKIRHLAPYGGHTYEVDEFCGNNEGLIFTEIELQSADEDFAKPDWLDKEVTGDRHYYNKNLLGNPYANWKV